MTGNTPNGYKEFILFFERGTAILRPDNEVLRERFFYLGIPGTLYLTGSPF